MATYRSVPASGVHAVEDVLAMMVIALVWLVPNHQLPWAGFHHELVMGLVLSAGCILAAWQGRWAMLLSPATIGLFFLSLLPWAQWALGIIPLSGQALVSSLYIAAVALAMCLGHAGAAAGDRLFRILAGGLVLGALLNVPVQIIQWYQWYTMELDSIMLMLVTPINSAQRPSGLILQPNQLATIQVWGLIGMTWLHVRGHVGRMSFLAVFVVVGVGLGLTQSRAGLLEMVFVAALLSMACWHRSARFWLASWWSMTLVQVVWALNFKAVADWLRVPTEAVARLSSIDGARLDAWKAYWAAVLREPWRGHGVGDLGHAYTTVAADRPEIYIGQRFAHSHNAVLDLVLWVGIPLAVVLLLVLSVWAWRCLRAVAQQRELVFPLAVLAALAIHAMLELPHQFLYFLVPAAICAGWLHHAVARKTWQVPKAAWVAAGATGLLASAVVSIDYFPYQERYTEWRYENARVGTPTGIAVEPPWVLNQIHDEIALYRLPIDAHLTDAQLQWVNRVAAAVASPAAYHAAAKANAQLGHVNEARDWMMRLNAMLPEDDVKLMQYIWKNDQARLPRLTAIDWPPYQGKRSTVQFTPEYVMPRLGGMPDMEPLSGPASSRD